MRPCACRLAWASHEADESGWGGVRHGLLEQGRGGRGKLVREAPTGKACTRGARAHARVALWHVRVDGSGRDAPSDAPCAAGNSAAALLDHILFKEVGRVVVRYESAMSVIRVPMAQGDIIALHEKTINGLLAGLPERLQVAPLPPLNLPAPLNRHSSACVLGSSSAGSPAPAPCPRTRCLHPRLRLPHLQQPGCPPAAACLQHPAASLAS